MKNKNQISIILPNLRYGGAQNTFIRLANIFFSKGHDVELIILGNKTNLANKINKEIKCIYFNKKKITHAFVDLSLYLLKKKPYIIMTCLHYLNIITTISAAIFSPKSKILISERGPFSKEVNRINKSNYIKLFSIKILAFISYRRADYIVAVSKGIAKDLALSLNLKLKEINVIYNPSASKKILSLSKRELKEEHKAIFKKPTIVSVGRLEKEKGYDLLLKAFSSVLKKIDCSLLIIGEGSQKKELTNLIKKYKIKDSVYLIGILENPYPYIKRGKVFILSSREEGLPNVLIEAMAIGKTVISTDCDYGPREIIGQKNKWGYLIKNNDHNAMAETLLKVLKDGKFINPKEGTKRFTEQKIYNDYKKIIFAS